MSIVYSPGCWDLLHVGHLNFLEQAAEHGKLMVGVASDEVIVQDKGRPPIVRAEDRLRMVRALRCVSWAEVYTHLEFLGHLNVAMPDVLAVGEFWGREPRHLDAEQWCSCNGSRIVRIPYWRGESTSAIVKRIRAGG